MVRCLRLLSMLCSRRYREIDYKTNKVRNHKAPSGSGAPVGTEYHWLIVASQRVVKVDANTYETHLTGSKYKLAHKSVGQA